MSKEIWDDGDSTWREADVGLTKRPRIWHHIDMSNSGKVYEAAADSHGLITVEDAATLGVHRKQPLPWEAMGRLERRGRPVVTPPPRGGSHARQAYRKAQPSAKTASASRRQYRILPTETTPSFGR